MSLTIDGFISDNKNRTIQEVIGNLANNFTYSEIKTNCMSCYTAFPEDIRRDVDEFTIPKYMMEKLETIKNSNHDITEIFRDYIKDANKFASDRNFEITEEQIVIMFYLILLRLAYNKKY